MGNNEEERVKNLVQVMDGYFDQGAHHLNVNVFGKEKLIDAMEHPEKKNMQTSLFVYQVMQLNSLI